MIVEGYTIDLYCDNEHGHILPKSDTFPGKNKTSARRAAKAYGWTVNDKHGIAVCPECKAKGVSARTILANRKRLEVFGEEDRDNA